MFGFFMCVCILLCGVNGQDSQKIPFEIIGLNGSGIFFRDIANARYYNHNWVIFTKMPVVSYRDDIDRISEYKNNMETLCSEMEVQNMGRMCSQILNEIKTLIENLEELEEEIDHKLEPKARKRRSFFDGVGSLAKSLFGTMDAEDETQIKEKLDVLKAQGKENFDLIKHQVTVVKSLFDSLNQTLIQMERDNISSKLNELSLDISKNSKTLGEMKVELGLLEMSSIVTMEIIRVERAQENFISAVTALQLGKIHPKILKRDQIMQIYQRAGNSIGIKNLFKRYSMVMQMVYVESVIEENEIFIKIVMPIVEDLKFDVFRAVVVPQKLQGKLVRVLDVSETYVAINMKEKQYMLMNDKNFKNCKRIITNDIETELLCELNVPVMTSSSGSCMLQLFLHEKDTCKYRVDKGTDAFVKLGINEWLCIIGNTEHLRVVCNGGSWEVDLEETGIIRVESACDLHVREVVIKSESSINEKLVLRRPQPMIPIAVNISQEVLARIEENFNKTISGTKVISLIDHNYSVNKNARDIQDLIDEVNAVDKSRQDKRTQIRHTVVSGVFVGISLLAIILIIFALNVLRKRIKTVKRFRPSIRRVVTQDHEMSVRMPKRNESVYEVPVEIIDNVKENFQKVSNKECVPVHVHPEYNLIV